MSFSGLGAPGARTTERKDWLTEIKKGVLLTIVIWLAMCLLWFSVSFIAWLIDPYSTPVQWFRERPRIWLAVNVGLGIPCLFGLIVWARQELLDADWTSLQGKHGLSGIMPMTPFVRLVLFMRWLRASTQPRSRDRGSVDISYRALYGGDDDDE